MVASAASVRPRATPSRAAWLGWLMAALYVALALGSILLEIAHVGASSFVDLWSVIAVLAYAIIGALIVSRQPRHPIGWMFCACALSFGIAFFSGEYAVHALVVVPGTLPFGHAAAWFHLWAEIPGIAIVGLFLPLLFPEGRLPSPRWRPAAFGAGAIVVLAAATSMFAPTTFASMGYPSIRNPFGLDGLQGLFDALNIALEPLLLVVIGVSAAALAARLRGADAIQRQQLKWFVYAGALVLTSFAVSTLADVFPIIAPVNQALVLLALAALPIAVGVAILHYGLYEIDLIVNKTIVYVLLTAALAGVYSAAVAFFQRLFVATTGQSSDLAIVATLFVLATVFTPIKNTLQETVDRRVKPGRPATRTSIDDLVALSDLHQRGILTDDEFAAKKKQILRL